MRELRFRAWVFYGENLEKPHYSRDYDSLDRFFEDHDENDTDQCIEQYTGLKDKNGKEIYEGDIVRCGTLEGRPAGVVVFRTDDGWYEVDDPLHVFGGEHFGKLYTDEMEVIGNIHENPELRPAKSSQERGR